MTEYKGRDVKMQYVGYATVREAKPDEQFEGGIEAISRLKQLTLEESADIAWM